MDYEEVLETVERAREEAEERNFNQTFDLVINLKNIDLSRPENRFTADIVLPNGRGKAGDVMIIADSTVPEARKVEGADVLTADELEEMDEDSGRYLADYDILLAEAPLMTEIGDRLGPVLAPVGKMPTPYTPGDDLEEMVQEASKTVPLSPKEPLIHTVAGAEDMEDTKVAENVRTVIETVERELHKGRNQIDSVYLKLTMGPTVRLI